MFPLPEKTGAFTRLSGTRYLTHSLTLVRTAQSVQAPSAFLRATTFLNHSQILVIELALHVVVEFVGATPVTTYFTTSVCTISGGFDLAQPPHVFRIQPPHSSPHHINYRIHPSSYHHQKKLNNKNSTD